MNSKLFAILRAFASLLPTSKIDFPNDLPPFKIHAFFLDFILLNPQFQQYPPSEQYQRTFWKWAIYHLENMESDEDFEIDPCIYEHYLSLLPSSGLAFGPLQPGMCGQICPQGLQLQSLPAPSFVTHFWRRYDLNHVQDSSGSVNLSQFETVTLLESRTIIESGTTGHRTWLASFIMSQYLTNHPELIKGKRILELGSGIGFLGIIVARLQQLASSEVSSPALWLTDVNEDVLVRCRDNVQMLCNMSSKSSNISYRFLDWFDSLDSSRSPFLASLLRDKIDADLILGADLVFDPNVVPALLGALELALQPGRIGSSKIALIATTIRNEDTFAGFLQAAEKRALHVKELDVGADESAFMQAIDCDGGNFKNVKIFQITL